MLHVLTPSGEEMAAIPAAGLSSVQNLKKELQKICGVPRFRQKILHEGTALEEDVCLDVSMESVLLVLVTFCAASEAEIEELVYSPGDSSVEEVEKILQRSIDPNATTADGKTALMQASQDGYTEIVVLLLEARADMDMADHDGVTPLLAVSREGGEDMIRWLLAARADLNKADSNDCTPLIGALQEGRVDIARLLVQAGAGTGPGSQGSELLYSECCEGNLEVVGLLLEARVDPNYATEHGATALVVACGEGHPEIVQLLLASKADANRVDADGFTALFLAAQNKHSEVVRLLVHAGADPDKEIIGTTALASATVDNSVEVVRWLLHAKVAIDQVNEDGQTPLNTACSFGHVEVVRLLVQAVVDRIGLVGLDRVDKCGGYTALHCASIHNFLPVARVLVEAGASKDIEDEMGYIPFDYAKDDDMAQLLATERPRRRDKDECSEAVESDNRGDEEVGSEPKEKYEKCSLDSQEESAEVAAHTYVAGLLSPFIASTSKEKR